MNCIQCGNAIDNDAAWCPNCGSRVDNQPVQTQPVQPVAQPEAQQFTQPVTQPMQPQYSNPVSQTTTSFDSVPASDPAPAFDPAPAPAPVKMSKKTKIILSVVGVLVVILGLTYYFVQKNVYSQEATVKRYVTALENGNFTEANNLVDWTSSNVPDGTRVLMNNNTGKNTENRIANSSITDLSYDSKRVTYKINGQESYFNVELTPPKQEWLVFSSYKIKYPTISSLPVEVPSSIKKLNINGTLVNLDKYKKSSKKDERYGYTDGNNSDSTRYSIPVYPGTYTVKPVIDSPFVEADSIKDVTVFGAGSSADTTVVNLVATNRLAKGIAIAVKKEIDKCVASTEPEVSKECEFAIKLKKKSYGFFSDLNYDYSDIKRSVEKYPKINDINTSSSTFSTDPFTTKVKYRYKVNDDKDWKDGDQSDNFCIYGRYKINGDNLSVSFGNNEN